MTKIHGAFSESWKIIRSDRMVLLLCLVPVLIGGALYGVLGTVLFSKILDKGQQLIDSYLAEGGWGTVAYYVLATLLTVFLVFIVNWTFFLVVSLLASPFNDLISARVEKHILGKNPEDAGGLKELFKRLGRTLVNEFKKISVILVLTLIALSGPAPSRSRDGSLPTY